MGTVFLIMPLETTRGEKRRLLGCMGVIISRRRRAAIRCPKHSCDASSFFRFFKPRLSSPMSAETWAGFIIIREIGLHPVRPHRKI